MHSLFYRFARRYYGVGLYVIRKIFADGGYAGPKLAKELVGLPVELKIVKRTDKEAGFKVLRRPKLVVELLQFDFHSRTR